MKRSWLTWFAIIAMMTMVFAVTGCSDDDDDNNGGGGTPFDVTAAVVAAGDDYFDDYKIEFEGVSMGVNVTPAAAFATIAGEPDYYYVVDMRSGADFAHMHIDGAVNVPMGNLVAEIENMPTDKIILVMCYSGQTASYATSIINLVGTQTGHVAQNLKFGASGILPLEDVKADGSYSYPMLNEQLLDMVTTPSPAKNAPGDYPALDDDVNTALDALKARAAYAASQWPAGCGMDNNAAAAASTDDLYLINYFSEANYLEGHLPNAIQYGPPNAFTSTEFLNTLPVGKDIGVYCYTGQTSAQVAAYLQMMGYQGKTVFYGVQKMAYDDESINDVPWHGPEDDYSSIFVGTGVPQ
jgi:rhodanese-related sulfurtransferase